MKKIITLPLVFLASGLIVFGQSNASKESNRANPNGQYKHQYSQHGQYPNGYHHHPHHYHNGPKGNVYVVPPRPVIVPNVSVHVNRPYPPADYYSSTSFRNLIRAIQNQRFEEDRLSVARQGVYNNYFSAQQIREIMETFSYESSRLSFAIFAYDNCVDKQNYYIVNNAFAFSDSIHRLEDHIYTRR